MFNSKQELKEYIRGKVRSVILEAKQIATTYQFSPEQFKLLKDFGTKLSTNGQELYIPELVYIDLQKNKKDSKFKQEMYGTVPPKDEYLMSQILTGMKKSLKNTVRFKNQTYFVLPGTLTKNGNFNFLNPYRNQQSKEEDKPVKVDEPKKDIENTDDLSSRKTSRKWDEENISQEAAKYSSRREFEKSSPAAFRAAYRLDLLPKLFPNDRQNRKWDEESLSKEAAKYLTRGEFKTKDPGAYYATLRFDLIDKFFPIKLHSGSPIKKWDQRTVSQEASKYSSKSEFQKNNQSAYLVALRLGLLDKLFPDTEPQKRWDEESISREAAKYSSRSEFADNSQGAYTAAKRLGILTKLFPNILSGGGPRKWDEETISREAAKYSSRSEFQKNNVNAYHAALRSGLIDKLFPIRYKKRNKNISEPEDDFFPDSDFIEEVKVKKFK